MTFHLMCVHIISSPVWVDEWHPFGKELLTRLTICSLCILTVTSMVGARTVRLMEESVGFPLGACAAARSRVSCRWGTLSITCGTCLGVGSVRVGIRFRFLYQPVTIKRKPV